MVVTTWEAPGIECVGLLSTHSAQDGPHRGDRFCWKRWGGEEALSYGLVRISYLKETTPPCRGPGHPTNTDTSVPPQV